MGADTMAVGEAAETQAEQQEQQQHGQAEGVEGARETVYIAPAATTSEPASTQVDEMSHPAAEVTSEEQPRVVTFVEPGATTAGGAHPKRHRVRTAAREAVEENLLPRVERIRQASNVVLDEAAYDPSLRFVLIALTLFFIFLIILLANNILG